MFLDLDDCRDLPVRDRTKIRLGPSGIHLFNRASGTNVLIDELVPPKEYWSSAPREVSIALTNSCDLSCPHCFAPKSNATLAFDRVVGWLEELDAHGAIGVGFGGGEPTLHPRFAELCMHASLRTGLAVTFTTHGHHLDDALLSGLKGHVHFIRVSMDGIGTTYERLRGRPFAALMERLTVLKEYAPFGINYLLNGDTLPEIEEAARSSEQVGASEFLLLHEQPTGGRSECRATEADALHRWVASYGGSMRLAVGEWGAAGLPVCNPLPTEIGLSAFAHIDAEGVLKRTSFDRRGVKIGDRGIISTLAKFHHRARRRP